MKELPKFSYEVTIKLILSKPDILFLRRAASLHYDHTCQKAGEVGGFIYGWNNMIDDETGEAVVYASSREIDLCLKILERETLTSFERMLRQAFKEQQAETVRLNGRE